MTKLQFQGRGVRGLDLGFWTLFELWTLGFGLFGILTSALVFSLLSCSHPAPEKGRVHVVTTLGVLADWAREVGGDRVQVTSLLTGLEGEHTYEVKPEDTRLIARAGILFRVGLGLEDWLNPVIRNAGNHRLTIVDASANVPVLQSEGGANAEHPKGNPHVWLDPMYAEIGIDNLVSALVKVDPRGDSLYRARARAYCQRLDSLTRALTAVVAQLPDRRFIAFHDAWPYFADRFGFQIAASIEPIPGQEPSARQIARLTDLIRSEHLRVLCSEPQLPSDIPVTLARETGIKVVILTPLTGAVRGVDDYVSLIRYDVETLVSTLKP
jgi:ABC-type Zn uptake system ZnuABC Zn-binding protein ZnuA